MIVGFDGTLINADLIYKITPIKEIYESNHYRTGCYDLDHRKPFYFSFEIIFLNDKRDVFIEKANYDPQKLMTKDEWETQRSTELAVRIGDAYKQTKEYLLQRKRIEDVYNKVTIGMNQPNKMLMTK
jgi:hypothetical protein